MALITGVHFILIIFVLDLIQTKHFLVETEDEMGWGKPLGTGGHDYQDDDADEKSGRLVWFPMYNLKYFTRLFH